MTIVKRNETELGKWIVECNAVAYEVPRIYLMFMSESPTAFVERVKRAQELRSECEARLRFEAVVSDVELSNFPKPPQRLQDAIRAPLLTRFNRGWIEIFEWEYCTSYQKTIAGMELIRLSLEELPKRKPPTNEGELKTARRRLQLVSLLACPEAIRIMEFINGECDDVSRMSLFHHQTDGACSLVEFLAANRKALLIRTDFLQREWLERVVGEVRRQLAGVNKGWLDLKVADWRIYQMSKLSRLIELVRRRMEMSVRLMVRSSLGAFVNHLCEEDFHPIFAIEILFDIDHEPAYTTDIGAFGTTLVDVLVSSILTTHEVPQIDPYLVTQIKFEKGLRLSSVGLLDDDVQEQIRRVRWRYDKCLEPLRSFAETFRRFKEFKTLVIPDVVRGLSRAASDELKDEISRQLKAIDEIELSVPATNVIGPFRVNVAGLKSDLIVKRRDLYDGLLKMFVDRIEAQLGEVSEEYRGMVGKLTQKFETVEELVAVREWLPEIPAEVKRLDGTLKKIIADFDILESFKVVVSDELMRTRITCQVMPMTIQQKDDDSQAKRKFDFEQFRKLQVVHEIQFHERVAALAAEIEAYSAQHDFDEVSRVASEMDEFWRGLSELTERGELLNHRQMLFDQPPIDTERLLDAVERLRPHHTLWTMAANFLQSKADWTLAPLWSVDVDRLEADVKRCESILEDSRLRFASDAEMMVLIGKISPLVDDANKALDVMRAVTSKDFEHQHWMTLSERTGIAFQFTSTTTFDSLLVRGIMRNADVVMEVAMEATREREARVLAEIEAEKKHQQEAEIAEQKKVRRARRKDI